MLLSVLRYQHLNKMIKKIIKIIIKNKIFIIPLVLLIFFIGSIWDRNYYIGGDIIFPLNPKNNILKSIYLWEEQNDGFSFFKYMLFCWQFIFYIFSLINIPSDIIIKIFIVLLYILGFISTALLYKIIFKNTKYDNNFFAVLCAVIFFLNPSAILILVGSTPLYGFPICLYLLVKFIDSKKILFAVLFSFFLNLTFLGDLPQAKLPLIFILSSIFILIIYGLIRNNSLVYLIKQILLLSIITLLLNAFVFIPFLNDAFGKQEIYKYYTQNVTVYDGNADLYSATVPYIMRFYNLNLVNTSSKTGLFLSSKSFIIWSFFLWFIILLNLIFIKEKKDKIILYPLLFFLIIFIFFAKGPNSPFGDVYRYLLFNVPVFKIFRTTATVIIGGIIFFSFLVTLSLFQLLRKKIFLIFIILVIQLIIFRPIYLGYKLFDLSGNKTKKGIAIPGEYFKFGKFLDENINEGKILVLPFDNGYIEKKWGYSGQSPLSWITKKHLVREGIKGIENINNASEKEICLALSLHNLGYIVFEKDTKNNSISIEEDRVTDKKIIDNSFFKLLKTKSECYLPVFYIPNKIIKYQGEKKSIFEIADILDINKNNFSIIEKDNKIDFLSSNHDDFNNILANSYLIISSNYQNNLNLVNTNYQRVDFGERNQDIFYPYVRINPNSFIYPFILQKEQVKDNDLILDKQKKYINQLFLASKRISEIEKWGIENGQKKLIVEKYKESMNKAIDIVVKNNSNYINDLEIISEHLNGHRLKIREMGINNSWNYQDKNLWTDIYFELRKRLFTLKKDVDYYNLSYGQHIPENGNYEIYLKDENIINNIELYKNSRLLIDNNLQDMSGLTNKNKKVALLGKYNFKKGDIKLNFNFSKKNIIDEQWKINDPSNNDKKEFKVNLVGNYFYQVKDAWDSNSIYTLNINYEGDKNSKFGITIYEVKDIINDEGNEERLTSIISREELSIRSKRTGKYEALIKSNPKSKYFEIYIEYLSGEIKLTDIKMNKVFTPEILLKKTIDDNKQKLNQKESINFLKINPTKYIVKINNIKEPFIFVFSENYNPGWKVNFVKKDKNNIITNYFLKRYSDFIKIIIGEKNIINEKNHFIINGYANGWYIDKDNISKLNDRSMIIEYAPQRYFYIGVIITIITMFFIILFKIKKNK